MCIWKVLPSSAQRNLVCSNRTSGYWFTAYSNPENQQKLLEKMQNMLKFTKTGHISGKAWAVNRLSDLSKLSCVGQRKVLPFRCTWIHNFQVTPTRTSGDALNSPRANMSFARNSTKPNWIHMKLILSQPVWKYASFKTKHGHKGWKFTECKNSACVFHAKPYNDDSLRMECPICPNFFSLNLWDQDA